MFELNLCCILVLLKYLFLEKNVVIVEEKIINEKGKFYFFCVKFYSNFWKGSGIVFKFFWGFWNRDEVFVFVKNLLFFSDGDIFLKLNFRIYGFDCWDRIFEVGVVLNN